METYCGKSCEVCTWKEELSCEGCRQGPGQLVCGDCKLAVCCRTARHETCQTCMDRRTCSLLESKDRMPEDRLRRRRIEAQQRAELLVRAPVLGKWLTVLFWLFIAFEAVSLPLSFVQENTPGLVMLSAILELAGTVACGLVFLLLSAEERCYKWAGILFMVTGLVQGLVNLLEETPLSVMLTLAAAVLGLVTRYYELNAYAESVSNVDQALSEQFLSLWKWFLWCCGAMIGGIILALLLPILGILLTLGGTIGIFVLSLFKFAYVYRAAKRFREVTA